MEAERERFYTTILDEKLKDKFEYMQLDRKCINQKLLQLLNKEKGKIFTLYNFVTIGIDRLVDNGVYDKESLSRYEKLLENTWYEKDQDIRDDFEKSGIELIKVLKISYENGFYPSKNIYRNLLDEISKAHKELKRRWKVLSRKELDNLRLEVSQPYAAGLFYLLLPQPEVKPIELLSHDYTLAAKITDDLTDIDDDVPLGFINVPREDIDKLHGIVVMEDEVKNVNENKLNLDDTYVEWEIKKAETLYEEADDVLNGIALKSDSRSKEIVRLIVEFMHSWFNESKKKYHISGYK